MRLHPCFAAATVALALLQSPARGDVSDADRATARALTLEGYEALDRKDYATAADRFERADALYHVPTVGIGLAHAEVGLGKLVKAVATYSRIVREGTPPSSPPAFLKAVDDARRELDALTARIPNVIIVVHGAEGVKVTIDGVEVPAAAIGVKRPVDPGTHIIRATAPTIAPSEVTVTVLEGKVETVTLDLKPQAGAPPPSTPPPVAPPPQALPPVAAPIAPAAPQRGASTQKVLGFVSIGVGAAGLGLGAIAGGLALSKHSALVEKCPEGRCYASQQAALQSDVDAYHTLGTLSTAGFIAGGVAAGAGIVLLITAPKESPERAATITPLLAPGFIGAQGRF